MLTVYSNQNELLNTTSTALATRINPTELELISAKDYTITFKSGASPELEVHVYTPDGIYLTGTHKAAYNVEFSDNTSQLEGYKYIAIDTVKELESLGINRGQYRIVYNLFDNVVGSFDGQKLWIKDISPSRTELRLQLTDSKNTQLLGDLFNLQTRWGSLSSNNLFDSFVLNLGFNETIQIVNFKFNTSTTNPEILVKLYTPLPSSVAVKDKVWISEEIIQPQLQLVSISDKQSELVLNTLAGPNFELEQYEGNSVSTDFKSWNDLLSANLSTSQQIIDAQFSGSLAGIKLNINYTKFDNFVHYSSAVERVKNFKYKMELIEHYTSQLDTVSNVIGGDIVQTNLSDLYTKRNAIVSSFDDFEKYLFFESTETSLYSNYNDTSTLTSGSVAPWPKQAATSPLTWAEAYDQWTTAAMTWATATVSDPYNYFTSQEATTSVTAIAYYNNLLEQAELYDATNIHKLRNAIPDYIKTSESNEELILFVDMLGQHFDILWTYIKNLTSIHSREEHPKDGMPDDLLYQVAKSMGFDLINGRSTSELWKYTLGVDENGNAIQNVSGSATNSIPDSQITKEVWRRIVNNLPYILKTKGTSRSIKALLTCFGIPSTLLTIKEYGGPSTFTEANHYPEYTKEVYHYAWLSDSGSAAITASLYDNGSGTMVPANTVEFRFRTDNNFTYGAGNYYNLLSFSSGSISDVYHLTLTKETPDDQEGTLTLFSTITGNAISASNLEIFDDSWHTIAITSDYTDTTLNVVRSLYGKVIYHKSASISGDLFIFPETGSSIISIASGSRNITSTTLPDSTVVTAIDKFNGTFHEFRIWSGSLSSNTLEDHTIAPNSYTYNVDRVLLTTGEEAGKPYTHLLQRFTFANTTVNADFTQYSVHPNQLINSGVVSYIGYPTTSSINFDSFEEVYYSYAPSLGSLSTYTNKIRIDSSSIETGRRLNTQTRVEKSSLEKFSGDSTKVGIYFSPQNSVNEDIYNQIGYFEIDDYIGNPDDVYNTAYSSLTNFSKTYWKKYNNRNNFESYFKTLGIYDFTLFKYIKRLLPQRNNTLMGLVVEPNVLERSKVKIVNKPIVTDLTYNANINAGNEVQVTSDATNNINSIIEMYPATVITGDATQIDTALIDYTVDINQLGTSWTQNRYIGKYKVQENVSYHVTQSVILNSRPSTYLIQSGSNNYATVNTFNGTGWENLKFNGCKLSASAINVDSPNTVDGGPVVKTVTVNPNQIIFANNQLTTIDKATTGTKSRSI